MAEKQFTTAGDNKHTDPSIRRTPSDSPMVESDSSILTEDRFTFDPTIAVADALVDEELMTGTELSEELHNFRETFGLDRPKG